MLQLLFENQHALPLSRTMVHLEVLPNELLFDIVNLLSLTARYILSTTNRHFRHLIGPLPSLSPSTSELLSLRLFQERLDTYGLRRACTRCLRFRPFYYFLENCEGSSTCLQCRNGIMQPYSFRTKPWIFQTNVRKCAFCLETVLCDRLGQLPRHDAFGCGSQCTRCRREIPIDCVWCLCIGEVSDPGQINAQWREYFATIAPARVDFLVMRLLQRLDALVSPAGLEELKSSSQNSGGSDQIFAIVGFLNDLENKLCVESDVA